MQNLQNKNTNKRWGSSVRIYKLILKTVKYQMLNKSPFPFFSRTTTYETTYFDHNVIR